MEREYTTGSIPTIAVDPSTVDVYEVVRQAQDFYNKFQNGLSVENELGTMVNLV